jgi:enoyl-CoA hydratase/carnithine racemase
MPLKNIQRQMALPITAAKAQSMGIIDEVVGGDLKAAAMAFARTFNKKRGVFGEMKRRMHDHIIEIIDEEDPEYIEPLNVVYGDW